MKIRALIYLLVLIGLIPSCGYDEECRKDKTVKLGVGFYSKIFSPKTQNDSVIVLKIDSITVIGLDNDSVLYNNTKNISSIKLPLKISANQSDFIFRINNITDTVTFLHENYDFYLSFDCGCVKSHSVEAIVNTNHYIRKISIYEPNVNTTNAEHIQIFN